MNRQLVALAFALALGCGKSKAQRSNDSPESANDSGQDEPAAPMDAREAAQWELAAQGDSEELTRLEDLVGCEGLRARASQPQLRMTAIKAMKYCSDFSELPWLADVAGGKSDAEARASLETVGELAARQRRATDPEDAEELHAGCAALLALAKSTAGPRERRVLAIRALRMLSERGCVRRGEIPTDVDAK